MNVKNLYLTKNEPIWFEVAQGAAGVQFGIRVQDYTIPAGAVVNIYVSKPDGTMVYNAAEVSGNTITVTTTTQMTAVVGVSNCQVQILSTGILLRTFVFHLKVRESIIDETAIESTDEFGALETALQTISDYDADILALQGDISDLQGDIAGINNSIGAFKCVSMAIGYQAGESILSVVQRAYANASMPKGAPFIALVASGAYYTLQGYWYTGQETGYCIVSLYTHSYFVSLVAGVWDIYGLDRSMNLAAGYFASSQALTTSLAIIPMGDDYFLRGCFTRTNDGGYKASKRIACVVSASGHVASATTGDTLVFSIGRYKGEWTFTGQSFLAAGATTDRSFSIPQYPMVIDENEIVYLRGRNATAARGSVDAARLLIQPVY